METLFIGRNIIFLPQVNSTNSYAIELLKNVNLVEGTVVHTADQTNGRGQRGSVWSTEKTSNLTASLIIKPTFLELKYQHYLYQIAALACYDVLAELLDTSQFDIKIKWPNDILVNNKKIAGILIENNISKTQISWSVIGVGLNINQTIFDESINAVSLKTLTDKTFEIEMILKLFCENFEKYYLQLKNNKLTQIKTEYLKHFFRINNWMDFEINNSTHTLLVKGSSDRGLLLLENKSGKQLEFDVKEIKWIV
ncbi:MAG: biotin--[acetyl-CoA-carboxylase] ligase [Bacteroidota bacterium]|nr:biotin--[acetyl-CoA-carboxylase] ligase [Bacteroidota bacterium]MDP3144789.1 biotin--[acetyl-CoA-carboxylase] ligase [Bacteroidota bacterium]MDP3557839.1 biotin--[acetyl-CoA-carboxylase] ligase [Bacteroidota bacterium]